MLPSPTLNLVVAIATAGRRDTLKQTLNVLAQSTRLPDEVVVAPAHADDCDTSQFATLPFRCRIVMGERGLTQQRNSILEATHGADVVAFLDDDFYVHPTYLERAEKLLLARPEVVGLTGNVLADGRLNAGIEHAHALEQLSHVNASTFDEAAASPIESLYGCNMIVRTKPIRDNALRFDINLPLYGWLEDLDFTRRLGRHGVQLRAPHLFGVHLATKRGRVSGLRVGYSQVANPFYLMRKGIMPPSGALIQAARNVARNLQRTLIAPEPWVDRRGRLRGNLLAFSHLITGRLRPENVTSLG
jgi:glycosyltransferase involved in cell wall biosynthesis